MKQTLEQRIASLEKSVAKLATAVLRPTPLKKDWRRMAGSLRDTKFAREADRLGRRYRAEENQS
jgi:hypothetical protein